MLLNAVIIITLAFAGFVLFIVVARIVRSLRRLQELRERRAQQQYTQTLQARRRPSDEFHDQTWLPLCDKIAAAAQRLRHDLSRDERRKIWRSRSPLVLEVLLKEAESAASPEALANLITDLPPGMDRPDPTGWCGRA